MLGFGTQLVCLVCILLCTVNAKAKIVVIDRSGDRGLGKESVRSARFTIIFLVARNFRRYSVIKDTTIRSESSTFSARKGFRSIAGCKAMTFDRIWTKATALVQRYSKGLEDEFIDEFLCLKLTITYTRPTSMRRHFCPGIVAIIF